MGFVALNPSYEDYTRDREAEAKHPRPKLPPVSKAKGGLMPGINLEEGSPEEAEDLEYIGRLKRRFEPSLPSLPRPGRPGGR
jgi:hypothetical protein